MFKETYERLSMDVTVFDAEDVIVTSGELPALTLSTTDTYEVPVGYSTQSMPIPSPF